MTSSAWSSPTNTGDSGEGGGVTRNAALNATSTAASSVVSAERSNSTIDNNDSSDSSYADSADYSANANNVKYRCQQWQYGECGQLRQQLCAARWRGAAVNNGSPVTVGKAEDGITFLSVMLPCIVRFSIVG